MASFKYKVDGIQQTMTLLRNFEKGFRTKTLRKAGNEASKIGVRVMKAHAPPKNPDWGTGTWRKSIGRKVKVYRSATLVYIVGPRSKVQAVAGKLKSRFWRDSQGRIRKAPVKGFKQPQEKFRRRRPVLYSHLLEPKRHVIAISVKISRPQEMRAIEKVLREAVASPAHP